MRKDPLSLFNIKGKTIILTGSSGFLGTQYAHALSKLHANLILVDYENKKNKQLEQAGGAYYITGLSNDAPSHENIEYYALQ